MNIRIRSINNCSWCWQDKAALKLIRDEFKESHKRMATCLTIYLCLAELHSNNNSADSFLACNKTIARMAGKSVSTIKNYCNHLISLRLLSKQARKEGKQNLANDWFLLETPDTPANNKYPTPTINNKEGSDNNNCPVLEENQFRNNQSNITSDDFNNKFESLGYRKLREKVNSLKTKSL